MAVGNQATQQTIDNLVSSLAVGLRNACDAIRTQYVYVNGLGLTGLEALGFTAADAQDVLTKMGYLNNVSAVYYGTGTQATASNFDAALSAVWAGQ